MRRYISRLLGSPVSAVLLAVMLPGPALAQVDALTLNIDNGHFNPVIAGGLADYIVRVDNSGHLSSTPTTITFTVPAGTVYDGVETFENCLPLPPLEGPATVACDLPALAPSATLSGRVNFRHMQEGTSELKADIGETVSFTRQSTVLQGADLSLVVSASPDPVQAGNMLGFSGTVRNAGPFPSSGSQVVFTLPTGVSTDVAMPAGCDITGNNIVCEVGALDVDDAVTLSFEAQVVTGEDNSTITMAATVNRGSPADPVDANNTDTVDVEVTPGTDVSLSKARHPGGLLLVGDTVTFTLTPGLAGVAPATARIEDVFPDNYAIVSVEAGAGWTCDFHGQELACDYVAGAGTTFTAPIIVAAEAVSATTIDGVQNIATISSSDENEGAEGNNSANDGTAHIQAPYDDLKAHKSGPPRNLMAQGQPYPFRLRAENLGNTGFVGPMTITDHLPLGLTVTAIDTPAGWTCPAAMPIIGPAEIECSTSYPEASPLAIGAFTPAIELTAEANGAATQFANGMTVSFPNWNAEPDPADRNPADNTTTTGTIGSADPANWADVWVHKSVAPPVPAEIRAGDEVTFRIEIGNSGPAVAEQVILRDVLSDIVGLNGGDPIDVPFTTSTPALQCQVPSASGYSRTLVCEIDEIEPCIAEDDCPYVEVTVRPGDEGLKSNTANAYSWATPDPDEDNNEYTVDYEVEPVTDVTVTKVSPFETAGAAIGQDLTYVVTASVPGNGLSGADNVIITDTLPAGVRFKSAVPNAGSCETTLEAGDIVPPTAPDNQLTCYLGRIENPGQQTVTIVVEPTLPQLGEDIVNSVTVSTDTPETDSSNNAASVPVRILAPSLDLIISKIDSVDPVEIHTKTTYLVTLESIGPSSATDVVVTDILPPTGLRDAQFTPPSGWSCGFEDVVSGQPGGTLTCTIGYLAAGEKVDFEVEMTAMARGRHGNTARVTSAETEAGFETIEGNNEVVENTTVRVRSDVGVEKSAVAPVAPHDLVTEVDLREEFAWRMVVTSHAGEGLDIAEAVTLLDTLPPGLELTRTPEAVTPTGTRDCQATGNRIDCDIGDLEVGESATVMVWAKIVEPPAGTDSLTNTATVSTLSFDHNATNDTDTASIASVRTSTVGGSIWWDFNDDGNQATHDTGVGGVTVNLTGIAARDGAPITAQVQTLADGSYRFDDLPPGTYSVSYDPAAVSRAQAGRALPGSGATADGSVTIDNIVVEGDSTSDGHDFTLVPQALVTIDKVAATPSFNADGSYSIVYTLTVTNGSREPLEDIVIEDDLGAATGRFGSYTASASPEFGEYTISSAPAVTGDLTGAQTGYTGQAGNTLVVDGGTLGAGQTSTVSYTLRVNPPMPRPSSLAHVNTATIEGTGEWSGQTRSTNPDLSDDDSATATPAFEAAIAIDKEASFAPAGEVAPEDVVSYTFTVTNTGNTPLDNVVLTDPLPGLEWINGDPIPLLLPDASVVRTASYPLTQTDIDNRGVANTASVRGQWGIDGSTPLTVSATDDAVVTSLAEPGLEILKVIDSSTVTDPTQVGQTITYRFTVTNTGNTNLRDVVVIDPRLGDSSPVTVGALGLDDSRSVTASTTVTQSDIDNGVVENTAFARGTFGPSGNTGTVDSEPSEADIDLHQDPQLTLDKVATVVPDLPRAGDTVTWTVTATNTGNVTLHDLTLSDDALAGTRIEPAMHASLAPGSSVDFTVTADLTQAHINAGEVVNQASIVFETPDGTEQPPVLSDDPDTSDPEDPTVTPLNRVPGIELVKQMITSIPATVMAETELRYRFTIRNTGNVPLAGLELIEGLAPFELDATPDLATTTLEPQNADGTQTGTEVVVEGSYALTQDDINAGAVTNEATATGTPTHGSSDPVSDDDEVTTSLARTPQVELVKAFGSRSGGVLPAAGDIVTYTFEIRNTGNVELNDLDIVEELIDAEIVTTGWDGPLGPGDSNSDDFSATYVLKQADIDRGYIDNTALVTGTGLGPDGIPQEVTYDAEVRHDFGTESGISVVKSAVTTALSEPPRAGDEVTYEFVVTNEGNVTLTDVVLTDPLDGLFLSQDTIPELLPGPDNAVTLTGIYEISQSDIQAGQVFNQASVTGETPDGDEVTSPSNPVTIPLGQEAGIAIIKSEASDIQNPTQPGEEIAYSFIVKNTGNLVLSDVSIADPLLGANPAFAIGTLMPDEEKEIGPILYPVTDDDIGNGEVENQATASGDYVVDGETLTTTDLSGPTFATDSPVIVELFPPVPTLTIEKTATYTGTGVYTQPGDTIVFEFLVTNTGNVTIEDVQPNELEFTFGGLPAEGNLSAFEPASATLERGESQVFRATYELTQGDSNAAAGIADGVENTAEAVGTFAGRPVVSPPDSALLTLAPQQPSDVDIVKSTTRPTIQRGETVPFIIKVTNNTPVDVGTITVTDRIPAGFVFVDGTAVVDDTEVVPRLDGNELVFEGIRLPPDAEVEISLVLRALPGTPPGRYINRAFGADALGNMIGEGRAVVDIRAEGVFDCSEVIGTVFNDLNGNGYQDQGEPGIPGVRLSTARGVLVTTDEFGRYSIPCAALPDPEIGSNFVLKLDARTLPTGTAVTTANPALVRLTAGKMVEVNFGAALGRQIKLTLSEAVFTGGEGGISSALSDGIDQLVSLLAEEHSHLHVTFETSSAAGARERLTRITDLIRQRWRAHGEPYALEIETLVVERKP